MGAQRCEPPLITRRGNRSPGCPARWLCVRRRDSRIVRDAAGTRHLVGVTRREPVSRPLPDVPGHVVEPVAVRGKAADGRCSLVAVELQVLPGELALPGVRKRSAVRQVLVAPGERGAVEAAARGKLPLGLGRQLLAGPRCVGLRVLAGDLHHRMMVAAVRGRAAPAGALPARAGDVFPPVVEVVERDRSARLPEDEPAGNEQLRIGVRVRVGIERTLGDGDVLRLADEPPELGSRDGVLVHPEAVHRHAVNRPFLRIEVLGAHRERRLRNPAKPGRRRRADVRNDARLGILSRRWGGAHGG